MLNQFVKYCIINPRVERRQFMTDELINKLDDDSLKELLFELQNLDKECEERENGDINNE